ncbi:hypothetical protein NRB15_05960 [Pseudomonas alliivorans]|uniref:hypothetical protein n=1 Tax=Pseudomonas alliivorans TaxID=2810613 RepID=UPI00211BE3E0|nr:hypothetical protein [Pseudomonas alliivorans]MCQ9469880.1 hypothetical protein [Pseudomonas alliivorans]
MSSKASAVKRVLQTLSTPSGRAATVFIPLLLTSSLSLARDGTLSFHGSVVNSSCEVSGFAPDSTNNALRSLTVSPGITLQIRAMKDACADDSAPFVADYQELTPSPVSPSAGQTTVTARAGLVTLTYQ